MSEPSGAWRPSGSCALFVCDIASFGHRSRTDRIQVHVRAALYAALRCGFDGAGVAFEGCYTEDRGDGVMIAVPPAVDTAVLLSSVVDLVRAELRRHNEVSNEASQIRLRVAVHTGEAISDGNGLVGTAVNHVFRILEAGPLKEALRDSGAGVAVIVSERVHEDVVRHGRGLVDPAEYQRIEIEVKETKGFAWMRLPGMRLPEGAQSRDLAEQGVSSAASPPRREGAVNANQILFELVDGMLALPVMAVERSREQVVSALSVEIAGVIPRFADARTDTYSILRTCLDYPGGLEELLQVIRNFVGDSAAMRRLDQRIAGLLDR